MARDPLKHRERQRRYYAANREKVKAQVSRWKRKYRRGSNLKSRYGLSIPDFLSLLRRQGNGCAICRQAPVKPFDMHVDHCHATGRVRGLLCGKCNTGIGMLQESRLVMESAIRYLEQVANPA